MKSIWEKKTMSSRRNSNPIPKINLEKKTAEKIEAMTNNILTMDFVLKNRKLLNKIKKCRVKVIKMSKSKLATKNRLAPIKKFARRTEKLSKLKRPGPRGVKEKMIAGEQDRVKSRATEVKETTEKESAKEATRENSKTPEESNKKSATPEPKDQEKPKERPEENETESEKSEVKEKLTRKKKTVTPDSAAGPRLNNRRKTVSSPAIKESSEAPPAKRQRANRSSDRKPKPIIDLFRDESPKREEKTRKQIFIRLPFNEISRLTGKKSKMQNKIPKLNLKKLGKTYLTEKYGGRYFRSHVKLPRFYDPKKPRPEKKIKNNRKSVSFVETVEVFGESDHEEESEHEEDSREESAPIGEDKDANKETSTKGEENSVKDADRNGADFESEDDVPLTPRKEDKFSALKAIDVLSPKSKEKRRSAEENLKNSSEEDSAPITNSVKRKIESSSVLIEDSSSGNSSSDSDDVQEVLQNEVIGKENDTQNKKEKDNYTQNKEDKSPTSCVTSNPNELSDKDDSDDEKITNDDDSVKVVKTVEDRSEVESSSSSDDEENNDKDKDVEKNKEDSNAAKSPINGKKQIQSEEDDIFSDADDFFNGKMQVSDTPKETQKENDEITGSTDKTNSIEQRNTSSRDKEADGD